MVPPCSTRISRVPTYSLATHHNSFRIQGFHLLRLAFPNDSPNCHGLCCTGLFRVRSPLLAKSQLISFPPVTKMFQFTGFACRFYVFKTAYLLKQVGCPIRRSSDHSLLPAPRGFSQALASFIASYYLGIHRVRLFS